MEEVWQHFSDTSDTSVHYTQFNTLDDIVSDDALITSMSEALKVRSDVLKALEVARNEGKIKDNQQAAVILTMSQDDQNALTTLIPNLAQWMIVSKVTLSVGEPSNEVSKAEGHVCPRCWNVVDDVDEAGLCPRCHAILNAE